MRFEPRFLRIWLHSKPPALQKMLHYGTSNLQIHPYSTFPSIFSVTFGQHGSKGCRPRNALVDDNSRDEKKKMGQQQHAYSVQCIRTL